MAILRGINNSQTIGFVRKPCQVRPWSSLS